jgi:hypothetical protein
MVRNLAVEPQPAEPRSRVVLQLVIAASDFFNKIGRFDPFAAPPCLTAICASATFRRAHQVLVDVH